MRATVAALVALALLVPGPARADDMEKARQLFVEGVKLFQRADYEGARRLFKRADAEHHAAPIVYNIGLAEERTGHPQAAVDAYEAYVAEKGDDGELTPAAVVAIAQIKTRSTRLRIETKPAGARLFVDASTLADPSPATFLVAPGHHVVVAQGDGWRAEYELEAKGGGDTLSIALAPPIPIEVVAVAPIAPVVVAPPPSAPPEIDRTPAPPEEAKPDGVVWGSSFALTPYHLQGATLAGAPNASGVTQAVAGAVGEVGYALTDRFELLGRGIFGLGPNGKPTYAWMIGPAVSLRLGSSLWLGAAFVGGQLETRLNGIPYGTDLVFGAMAETALALISTKAGQWTVGTQPGLLLTDDPAHNTAYFVALTLGFRAY